MENTVALNHSPSVVRDGLVFYYDMANTQKSWRGKPTTNYISNATEEMPRGEFGQYRDLAPIFDTYGLVPYSLSMDIKVSKPGNVLVYMQNGSSTKYAFVGADVNATTEYQRFYFNNITPAISTPSDTAATLATYTGYGSGVNPTVKNIQLELGTFATPFVAGTRSNTQAVVDLVGNNTVTANSLTYASDGTFSFNGSSDYLTIPNTTLGNGNVAWTVSCWMKTTTTTNDLGQGSILSNISGGPVYSMMGVNNGKIVYWTYQGGWAQKLGVGTTVNDGNWHMLTWVNYANYTMDMYVDGVLDSNVANSTSGNNNPVDVIGRSWAGYFPGSITSLSRYTKSLSATEVQQNFNAQRGRYGL